MDEGRLDRFLVYTDSLKRDRERTELAAFKDRTDRLVAWLASCNVSPEGCTCSGECIIRNKLIELGFIRKD